LLVDKLQLVDSSGASADSEVRRVAARLLLWRWLVDWLVHWRWLVVRLWRWLVHWLVHWLVGWLGLSSGRLAGDVDVDERLLGVHSFSHG
jgi:hypothetical protein